MHKMNSNINVQANVIDGATGQDNIADHWRQHFQNILNANDCDKAMIDEIMRKFENIQHDPDMVVSTNCIFQIIAELECGKSAGPDGIRAEHLTFSNVKIHSLIALCFTLCLSHGYLPTALIETAIIVKINLVIYPTAIIIDRLLSPLLFLKYLSLLF